MDFYPRSPRGERRGHSHPSALQLNYFYPRSPRGERLSSMPPALVRTQYFYPRSPRGERRGPNTKAGTFCADFYPRSPRGERQKLPKRTHQTDLFLSTLPARGATPESDLKYSSKIISIHAPREGSDPGWKASGRGYLPFLSTLPARGATFVPLYDEEDGTLFLSTLPARGATVPIAVLRICPSISIHAPREGSDCTTTATIRHSSYFYPRSPRGERPAKQSVGIR